MTITTKTYDDAVYQLVPVRPSEEMRAVIRNEADIYYSEDILLMNLLAVVPADLPGVVTHSGEPFCWWVGGQAGPICVEDAYYDSEKEAEEARDAQDYAKIKPLYLYPAPTEFEQLRQRVKELDACYTAIDEAHWLSGGIVQRITRLIREHESKTTRINELEAQLAAQPTPEAIVKAALEAAIELCKTYSYPVVIDRLKDIDPAVIIQAAKEDK